MADDDTAPHAAAPTGVGDITPPSAATAFEADESLKGTGAGLASADGRAGAPFDQAKQSARDNLAGFGQQAADKAREVAETGKERVGGLLDQLAQMLSDAAGQVDERLGEQYGVHARHAASSVQGLAQTVRDKDVDEFADDVRGYVSRSPAVALGIAAALGFGLARLVHAGVDQRD